MNATRTGLLAGLILGVEFQISFGVEQVAATNEDSQLAALGLTGAPYGSRR